MPTIADAQNEVPWRTDVANLQLHSLLPFTSINAIALTEQH
ncbi:hypothetical protein [Trichocoleus sp. FACHB-90]|nr:hypothetical protein [Trichocoleus sp. FACHB-90]